MVLEPKRLKLGPHLFFFFFLRDQGIELVTRTGSYQRIQDRSSLKGNTGDRSVGVASSDPRPQVLELLLLQGHSPRAGWPERAGIIVVLGK